LAALSSSTPLFVRSSQKELRSSRPAKIQRFNYRTIAVLLILTIPLLNSCTTVKEYEKINLTTPKWFWETERLKRLNSAFNLTEKDLRAQMPEKLAVVADVIKKSNGKI
jgi:hypothetical protein